MSSWETGMFYLFGPVTNRYRVTTVPHSTELRVLSNAIGYPIGYLIDTFAHCLSAGLLYGIKVIC
jgi:hypothetical protein